MYGKSHFLKMNLPYKMPYKFLLLQQSVFNREQKKKVQSALLIAVTEYGTFAIFLYPANLDKTDFLRRRGHFYVYRKHSKNYLEN